MNFFRQHNIYRAPPPAPSPRNILVAMIHAVLVLNCRGLARLESFYGQFATTPGARDRIRGSIINALKERWRRRGSGSWPNFLLLPKSRDLPADSKLLFSCFATLVVIIVCSTNESELGTLDLMMTYVKALDFAFGGGVTELDLIFDPLRAQLVLNAMILGGLVHEPRLKAIQEHLIAQGLVTSRTRAGSRGL